MVLRQHRCRSEDSSACLGERFCFRLCGLVLLFLFRGVGDFGTSQSNRFRPKVGLKIPINNLSAALTCSHLSQGYVPINQYGWQGRSYRINVAWGNVWKKSTLWFHVTCGKSVLLDFAAFCLQELHGFINSNVVLGNSVPTCPVACIFRSTLLFLHVTSVETEAFCETCAAAASDLSIKTCMRDHSSQGWQMLSVLLYEPKTMWNV